VRAAGEAFCAPERVVAPFCGVRAETAAFLIFPAGDCDCDCPKSCDCAELEFEFELERKRLLELLDCTSSEVEDMAVDTRLVILLTGTLLYVPVG
jgi:hypothetical protein